MPLLWKLHLSRHVRGMVHGPVQSRPAMLSGFLCQETGEIMRPDPASVAKCLPACYRKAFDRSGGRFWHSRDDNANKPATLPLYDRKGKYLNTIYAFPYHFRPIMRGGVCVNSWENK